MKNISINIQGTNQNSFSIPLEKLSHTIIFGDTGSGKSNLLHTLITNLIKAYSPDELKLALIDPKQVEFDSYKNLPHIHNALIKSTNAVPDLLNSCIDKIKYNNKNALLIIIDEIAELTLNEDIMSKLTYLLNEGAKHNIYIIMATQRPSAIPDEIINKTKTQIYFPLRNSKPPKNFSSEFKTAETLNCGEMLFTNGTTKLQMQTEYINQSTIENIINKCKNKFKQKTLSVFKIKDGFDDGIYYIDGYENGVFNWEYLNLDDDYAKQSSKLIEQAINHNLHLEIFVNQENDRFYISDGFKRIYAFISFLKNEYSLTGVDNKYVGKFFRNLTPELQEIIKSTPIDLIITKS